MHALQRKILKICKEQLSIFKFLLFLFIFNHLYGKSFLSPFLPFKGEGEKFGIRDRNNGIFTAYLLHTSNDCFTDLQAASIESCRNYKTASYRCTHSKACF